jgi:putative pyrroloquinoline-quinone binding quinoprotein
MVLPVAAFATPGQTLWTRSYDGPAGRLDQVFDLAIAPDGSRLFVTGESIGTGSGRDFTTIAYDPATGAQMWRDRYDGPAGGWDDSTAIEVAPDGSRVFVTGFSEGNGGNDYDFATIAYDPVTGDQLWIRRYDGPNSGPDHAQDVAVLGSRVLVIGTDADSHGVTIAYDAGTGAKLWGRVLPERFAGFGNVEAARGRVLVAGSQFSSSPGPTDYRVEAYRVRNGALLWSKDFNGYLSSSDIVSDAVVSPDGSALFVTGTAGSSSFTYKVTTLAFDSATGARTWKKVIDPQPSGPDDDSPVIAVAPDGSRVFVTATRYDAEFSPIFVTAAYTTAGVEQWTVHENDDDDMGSPRGIAVSASSDRVFVTGTGANAAGAAGPLTIAYDAAAGGPSDWEVWLEGSGHSFEYGEGIAAMPNGSTVFIAGSLGKDFITEAYATS